VIKLNTTNHAPNSGKCTSILWAGSVPVAVNRYTNPILIQNAPHIVLITVTSVSLALNPNSPAINCASPPKSATKGKKTVGESELPHQPAIQEAVIQVEPAKPARPSAAGGATGRRKMLTRGLESRISAVLESSPWALRAILRMCRWVR